MHKLQFHIFYDLDHMVQCFRHKLNNLSVIDFFLIDCYLPLRKFWLSWLMVMFVTLGALLAIELEDEI